MNRITIFTCAWKRPSILEIALQNWKGLNPSPHIVVCGSPGDDCREVSEKYGADYFQRSNKPLGNKFNEAAKRAKDTADYYLIMGSDDLMSQKMWEFYQKFEGDFLGLKDYYFYELKKKRLMLWKGYPDAHESRGRKKHKRYGHPIGAAKLLSHKAMEIIGFEPFESKREFTLDFDVEDKLKDKVKIEVLSHSEVGGMSVDMKSGINMHKFSQWDNSILVSTLRIKEIAPDLEKFLRL